MRARLVVAAATAAAIAVCGPASAKDLGVYGATFNIVEQDLLSYLAAKLEAAKESGKLEALNKAFLARSKARIERPPPVAGITHTVQPRSWLFDPTITVPKDFADQNGRVFAHRGDRINPLDRLPGYNRVLVFVDGDDAAQMSFALKRAKKNPLERVYVVLTKGAPLDLMKKDRVELFFDQTGYLTTHFGVTHVPAVVEPEGHFLRVSEVKP